MFYLQCETVEHAIANLCEYTIEKLDCLFLHGNAMVLQVAAKACYRLLESKLGIELAGKFIYIIFILISNMKKICFSLIGKYPLLKVFQKSAQAVKAYPLEYMQHNLDLTQLFSENSMNQSHSIWIKNLAIELFKLFDGEYLAEVAATQVLITSCQS